MKNYDYIVIGAGSSGCVLASRLSQNLNHKVLLIESGGQDSHPFIKMPATFFKVIEKGRDIVAYVGEPSKKLNNRPSVVLQGQVVGGGSSVNAMLYVRGQAEDYDSWAREGNTGWSYADVLPVFRDMENNMELADDFHGTDGKLHVSETGFHHPLSRAFIRAAQQAGIAHNPDFNGANQQGVGFYQTTTHNGRRWSSAEAFLREAEPLPNLTIMTQTRVARVLFSDSRASGVELENGDKLNACKEVILCAGAIETPRLLQLSGIGDSKHLQSHGIDVVSHLPGVGENYQDHLETTVQGVTKHPISFFGEDKGWRGAKHLAQYLMFKSGMLTSNAVESGGFIDVSDSGRPDLQFHVLPFMVGWVDREPIQEHGISIGSCFLRPKSRGSVKLRSANCKDPALFDAGSFNNDEDLEILVRGVKESIKILEAPSLARLIKRRALPEVGIENDDEALRDYVRQTAKTVFHPVGTAKMGPTDDPMAVVDTLLRVRGVQGLRVADASIMPQLISGNTNAPSMMIAERAYRFITHEETLSQ